MPAPTIYTIGYQPIEVISRQYAITDIINLVMTKGVQTGNLKQDVIQFLKSFRLEKGDKFLLNTVKNKDLIPYVWEELNSKDNLQNLLVYDPPYVSSDTEIFRTLKNLFIQLGGKPGVRTWIDSANSVRDILTRNKDNMPQKDYYNAMLLLSDINKTSADTLIQHIMKFDTPWDMRMEKKAIFFGDPVDPRYIEYLNSIGIFVVAFVPYESFTVPCQTVEQYYFDNPLYQSHLFMLIELRRLISFYFPDMIIMNPGGIYLTKDDANFFSYKLAQDVKIKMLPGTYAGEQITL